MRDWGRITDEKAEQATRRGLTPEMLQEAYERHLVRFLAESFDLSAGDVRDLARRWQVML